MFERSSGSCATLLDLMNTRHRDAVVVSSSNSAKRASMRSARRLTSSSHAWPRSSSKAAPRSARSPWVYAAPTSRSSRSAPSRRSTSARSTTPSRCNSNSLNFDPRIPSSNPPRVRDATRHDTTRCACILSCCSRIVRSYGTLTLVSFTWMHNRARSSWWTAKTEQAAIAQSAAIDMEEMKDLKQKTAELAGLSSAHRALQQKLEQVRRRGCACGDSLTQFHALYLVATTR